MDVIKILKRAWQVLWNYRALWVFGVILALATGGVSGGGSRNFRMGGDGRERNPFKFPPGERFPEGLKGFREWFEHGLPPLNLPQIDVNTWIWIAVSLAVCLLVLIILLAVARYVAETALMRMVDDHEASGVKIGFRQGWRLGWSRTSWRLFLINLLVNLPVFLFLLALLLLGLGIYYLVDQGNQLTTITGIVGGIGVVILFLFFIAVISVVLALLRQFFWRACALEQLGVRASLRRGFDLVRRNWKSVGLMWLVMIGLGIAWSVALLLAFILMIPVMVVTALAGVIAGGLPTLLVGGISSLFLDGWLPWIIGGLFGLPLFLLATFSPMVFLQGMACAFTSTVWTLTYRELVVQDNSVPAYEPDPEIPAPS